MKKTMKKLTLITALLGILAIANAQIDENNSLDSTLVQKRDLIMPQRLTDMVVTKLENSSIEDFIGSTIKNKEQLEKLQLGKPLREFILNHDKDTLIPQGWQVPILYEGKPVVIAFVSGREVKFGLPRTGENINRFDRDDMIGILSVNVLPTEFYIIRKENKDVFLQVFDLVTRKFFVNEYSFSEIINLRNKALELRTNPTKEGRQEIYGKNAPRDENDIFDSNSPLKA
jgi:hypothetical protein